MERGGGVREGASEAKGIEASARRSGLSLRPVQGPPRAPSHPVPPRRAVQGYQVALGGGAGHPEAPQASRGSRRKTTAARAGRVFSSPPTLSRNASLLASQRGRRQHPRPRETPRGPSPPPRLCRRGVTRCRKALQPGRARAGKRRAEWRAPPRRAALNTNTMRGRAPALLTPRFSLTGLADVDGDDLTHGVWVLWEERARESGEWEAWGSAAGVSARREARGENEEWEGGEARV